MGLLRDKNEENKFHSDGCGIKSALFLHKHCYDFLVEKNRLLPVTIWWFLAVYKIGVRSIHIKDVTDYYHPQNNLTKYYGKGYDIAYGKPEDDPDYGNEKEFIWLLHNPKISEKKKNAIENKFNKMLITYDWKKSFEFAYFKLK